MGSGHNLPVNFFTEVVGPVREQFTTGRVVHWHHSIWSQVMDVDVLTGVSLETRNSFTNDL